MPKIDLSKLEDAPRPVDLNQLEGAPRRIDMNMLQDAGPRKVDLSQLEDANTFVEPIFDDEFSAGGFVSQLGIGFMNSFFLDAPLWAMAKHKGEESVKAIESQNPAERFGRGIGTTLGFAVGAPGFLFKAGVKGTQLGAKALVGANRLNKMNRFAKGAMNAAGGVAALEAGTFREGGLKQKVVDVPTAALFGAVTGVAGEAVAPKVRKFLRDKGLVNKGRLSGTKELDVLNDIIDAGEDLGESSVKIKFKRLGDQFKTEMLDRHALIRGLEESVERAVGRSLPMKVKPSEQIGRFLGTLGIIDSRVGRYGKEYQKAGRFTEALVQLKTAQRLLERAKRGIGNPRKVGEDKANKMIEQIRGQVGDDVFNNLKSVARQQRRLLRRLLYQAEESGFIDKKTLREIIKKNQHYTPFEVLDYMHDNASGLARGSSFRTSVPNALKKQKGTERDILNPVDAEIRYIAKMTTAIEKNNVKRRVIDLLDFDETLKEKIFPLASGTKRVNVPKGFEKVSVFIDGKKQEFAIDKPLADVLNGLNSKTIDLMTRYAGAFSWALRMGATQLNAAFFVPNMFRDFQQAKLTSTVGFSAVDWVRGFSSAIRKDKFYQMWLHQGAGFSGKQQIFNRPNVRSSVVPSLSEKINTSANPFKWLSNISEVSETTTRLGVFRRSLRKGLPLQAAVVNSRNASIDFARMGNTMQLANLWIPFLNARIQGTYNIAEAGLKTRPANFALDATGIIVMPQVATYMWNTTQFPEVWDDIRQFEKEDNFIFIYGRERDDKGRWLNVAMIPKGDAGKVIGNPIENFLEFLRGNDPDFKRLAFKTLSDILPVDIERGGEFSGSKLLSSVLPPPIKAATEGVTNQNLFTGIPIVPRRLEDAPPEEQFEFDTAPLAIELGKLLGVSPLKIENAAGTLFGNLGRQVLDPLNSPQTLTRRFSGAVGNRDREVQFNILEGIREKRGAEKAKKIRKVSKAMADFKKVPPVPEMRRRFIQETFAGDMKSLETFLEMVKAEQNGQLPIYKTLKNDPVIDRLQFIKEYSQTLESDEEKIQFLNSLLVNRVITPESIKRMEKQ